LRQGHPSTGLRTGGDAERERGHEGAWAKELIYRCIQVFRHQHRCFPRNKIPARLPVFIPAKGGMKTFQIIALPCDFRNITIRVLYTYTKRPKQSIILDPVSRSSNPSQWISKLLISFENKDNISYCELAYGSLTFPEFRSRFRLSIFRLYFIRSYRLRGFYYP